MTSSTFENRPSREATAKAARQNQQLRSLGESLAAAQFWQTLRSVMGANPPERTRQVAADAVLVRILIDRGIIDDPDAANAAQDRDRSGLLLEHVLHMRYGVPMDDLLSALEERRLIMKAPKTA
jgi:hypothetical protein